MFKKLFGGLMGGSAKAEAGPNFEQRRKTARRPCKLEVEIFYGKSSSLGTVVDMGVGGLRLQTDSPLTLKNKALLRVTYPEPIPKHDQMTVECLTRWTKMREADSNQFIGVEFKDPKGLGKSWVKAKMQDIGFRPYNIRDQRSNFRVKCRLPATLSGSGGVKCLLLDVGIGGFQVSLRQPVRAGATIKLKLDEHPQLGKAVYSGTVRHQQHPDPSAPFGYGCSFVSLEPEQEEALKEFLISEHAVQWEKVSEWSHFLYDAVGTESATDDVEIPDLESIMEETEVAEETEAPEAEAPAED